MNKKKENPSMLKKVILSLLVLSGLSGIVKAEIEITPVADISLFGGQYYLDDAPSSFGGNSYMYFAPVVNFSETSALVPVFNLNYQGTKDVRELVGGGTLSREMFDFGAMFKYIKTWTGLKGKVRIGYKNILLNETEDEEWGKGLFDYNRILFGMEAEKEIAGYDISLAGDYYNIKFGNYSSLIGNYETSLDTATFKEISENAGVNVLDYSNIAFTLKAKKKYSESLSAFYSYRLDLRNYSDQTIVQSDGSFLSDGGGPSALRKDMVNSLSAGIKYSAPRVAVGLDLRTGFLNSNQNSFDANAAKFTDDFYSYFSTEFVPSVTFYLGNVDRLSRLKLSWALEFKNYQGRLAQKENADYLSDKINLQDNSLGISYSYPVRKNLMAIAKLNRRTASSNMKYEGNYKYNYTVSNYFLGINWQY